MHPEATLSLLSGTEQTECCGYVHKDALCDTHSHSGGTLARAVERSMIWEQALLADRASANIGLPSHLLIHL